MAEYNKKLYYRANNETHSIKLYDSADDLEGAFGPGPQVLTHGDMDEGYFGLLNSEDEDYIEPWKLLDAVWEVGASNKADLISQWGSKGNGTLQNLDTPWLKFAYEDKVLITPMKPIVHSISWDQIS